MKFLAVLICCLFSFFAYADLSSSLDESEFYQDSEPAFIVPNTSCLMTLNQDDIGACVEQVYAQGIQSLEEVPFEVLEGQLPYAHPSQYWFYVLGLLIKGRVEDSAFWYYAGLLRYEFYSRTNPKMELSGERIFFISMNDLILNSGIIQPMLQSPKAIDIIDRVLDWDEQTDNGFTSKLEFDNELQLSRHSLETQKDLLKVNYEIQKINVVDL